MMGATFAGFSEEVCRHLRGNAIRDGAIRRRGRDGDWSMGFIVMGLVVWWWLAEGDRICMGSTPELHGVNDNCIMFQL